MSFITLTGPRTGSMDQSDPAQHFLTSLKLKVKKLRDGLAIQAVRAIV